MPIYLTCICEKRLKVPEKLMGKKVRCANCHRVLMVPSSEQADTVDDAAGLEQGGGASGAFESQDSGASAIAQAPEPAADADEQEAPELDNHEKEASEQDDHEKETPRGEGTLQAGFVYATCSNCRKRVKSPAKFAGKRGKCPRCGDEVFMPWLPTARTVPEAGDANADTDFQELQTGLSGAANTVTPQVSITISDAPVDSGKVAAGTLNDDLPQGKLTVAAKYDMPAEFQKPELGVLSPEATRARKERIDDVLTEVKHDIVTRQEQEPLTTWDNIVSGPARKPLMAAALVLILASIGYLTMRVVAPNAWKDQKVYYYDLGSNELFEASDRLVPPIPAPSMATPGNRPAGVRAFVYSCGQCADPTQRFIGYFMSYTLEDQHALESLRAGQSAQGALNAGPIPQIATPEDRTWVAANSDAGLGILEQLKRRCSNDESLLRRCNPGDP